MARNFCFTYNNPTREGIEKLESFGKTRAEYCIWGCEIAPTTHTPHLQGYMELHKLTRWETIRKLLPGVHTESRHGTQVQAIDYCRKDGCVTEFGTPKKQGKRGDLDHYRSLAASDGMAIVTETANYQQIRTAEVYLTYNETPRDWKPTVIWIYGATGSGKSRLAREIHSTYCEDLKLYCKSDMSKWWPGYDRHGFVIIDDFRDSWWGITETLRLLDRYECAIEFKGGYRQFVPRVIIVTSINPPGSMYSHAANEPVEQLKRRIDLILRLDI